jgi:hypothetical protein
MKNKSSTKRLNINASNFCFHFNYKINLTKDKKRKLFVSYLNSNSYSNFSFIEEFFEAFNEIFFESNF